MTRTVVVIQARTGSTRLPGKVLMDLNGQPVLTRVIRRAQLICAANEVVVATSARPDDRAIIDLANSRGIRVYAGSEDDVLDRYYQAARYFEADVVIRVTADCPLLDPDISGQVFDLLQNSNADYASNVHPRTFPDGLDVEAFTLDALERAWRDARAEYDREHVTGYFYHYPDRFRISNLANEVDLSQLRWTIDYPEDLDFASAVYRHFRSRNFSMQNVLALLKQKPGLAALNARRAA